MDHSEAIRIKAAEQYLLGELTGQEREQYEEHFFSCQECAKELTATAAFVENAKEAFRSGEVSAHSKRPVAARWFDLFLRPAFAVPALAVLALVVTYQSAIVIPHLKATLAQATAPQTIPAFSLIAENSRGGNPVTIHAPQDKPFSIYLDIPPDKHFLFYNCELQTESGSPEFDVRIPADQVKETVQLLIPASRLRAGNHILVIRGGDAPQGSSAAESEISRYKFALDYVK
jgi:putative zinc finger protein